MPRCERATKRFLARYEWDGHQWACEVRAYDWADAEARCKALNLTLDGIDEEDAEGE